MCLHVVPAQDYIQKYGNAIRRVSLACNNNYYYLTFGESDIQQAKLISPVTTHSRKKRLVISQGPLPYVID